MWSRWTRTTIIMTVTPVPFEPTRFWVSSERPNIEPYLVDFDNRDEKWSKPKAVCGCPDCFAKGFKPCKHIFRVVDYLNHHENT